MGLIIGRSLTPLNSSRTMGSVRQHDDHSRGKVQIVRGDSWVASRDGGWEVFANGWRFYVEPGTDRLVVTASSYPMP